MTINKSPLNYSGSKDTLLPSILRALPANIDTFVDVMGGAFNVGANVSAIRKVVYNEINPYIYQIIDWLLKTDSEEVIRQVENIIAEYHLEKGARTQYEQLRDKYNESQNPLMLYVLHMYSFQNMIRFNGKHKFNTPIGVAGYSEDIKQRISNFAVKAPEMELINGDYTQLNWQDYPKGTVFYFDPPYFITSAAYNDGKRGMKGWSINEEVELLNTLNHINELGYFFILSNVMEHKGKENILLKEWVVENGYRVVDIGTSGWRYAKNEVLILNY